MYSTYIQKMKETGIGGKGGTNLIDILRLFLLPSPAQRQKRLRLLVDLWKAGAPLELVSGVWRSLHMRFFGGGMSGMFAGAATERQRAVDRPRVFGEQSQMPEHP
jgi:hypothetical protein